MATHSSILPGKFHGLKSLVATVLGVAELDKTKHTCSHLGDTMEKDVQQVEVDLGASGGPCSSCGW